MKKRKLRGQIIVPTGNRKSGRREYRCACGAIGTQVELLTHECSKGARPAWVAETHRVHIKTYRGQ